MENNMYTIKRTVVEKYLGDNKINHEMKQALIEEYNKNQLYKINSCISIMEKAMSSRSVRAFVKYTEQLEDELSKYEKQLDKELYEADE